MGTGDERDLEREDNIPSRREVGLCADCRHMRRIVSARGSAFYLCERARDDPRYPKYPRLPVQRCAGYEPLDAAQGGSTTAPASGTPASMALTSTALASIGGSLIQEDVSSTPSPSTSTSVPGLTIRAATVQDAPLILSFITQLAEYERLLDAVKATEVTLRETLFGARPAAEVLIAEDQGTPVGFALFFENYSTFLAQRGIYLEDLFVVPAARGRGVGRILLQRLARLAVERGCGRLEWAVLDWNTPAIGFYRRMGAVPMEDWTVFRLTGPSLDKAAKE